MNERLQEGEFTILKDDDVHIVQKSGPFARIKPIILTLTNYSILIKLKLENNEMERVNLSTITTFSQSNLNTMTVLDIASEGSQDSVHLFMDESHRETFISILSNLCTASEKNQDECDRYASMLKKQILSFSSLNEFYEKYNILPQDDLDNITNFQNEMEMKDTVGVSLNVFNFISDFVETSPKIFFILVAMFIGIVSIIFNFISFGMLTCCLILGLILQYGIQIVMGKVKKPCNIEINEISDSPVQQFVISSNKFHSLLEKRLLWGDSRKTLDTVAFVFFVLLLYLIYSPKFLLIFSVLCLAFFERWEAFNIGPLSSILSKLIRW